MKKERSCSGGMFEFPPSSPNLSRKSQKEKHQTSVSSNKLRLLQAASNTSSNAQLVDLTIFHIPGLDVKVTSLQLFNKLLIHINFILIREFINVNL